MTDKEVLSWIDTVIADYMYDSVEEELIEVSNRVHDLFESFEMLAKQSCEDAISRANAIDALNQSVNLFEATDRIEELPPVKPQNKSGEWIKPIYQSLESPKCNICRKRSPDLYNFCPNCGADMRGEKRNIL